ncbi:hypothetical protein ACFPM0_12735 [Pseudonocardia sulfidoxydans]|uniref:hypothetical protein n=1 Tax=Pseudonocardia sulfidoxydans TaxID=54011 RepID=UPI003607A434
MTAVSADGESRLPFGDAAPAQVRAELTTEDAAAFGRQSRRLMGSMTPHRAGTANPPPWVSGYARRTRGRRSSS